LTDKSQACRQVDGGGGFANATFLVGNAENFGHTELSKETEKLFEQGQLQAKTNE
jgi:hypothetical protein